MKIQDAGFILVLALLLLFRKKTWFVYAGLVSLAFSIPLFAKWIFFTGERLTWYAAAFFFIAIIISLIPERSVS